MAQSAAGRIETNDRANGEEAAAARRRTLTCAAIAVATALVLSIAQNIAVATFFPRTSRLATSFSTAYLRRELSALAATPGQTVFLGDSILWGFRLPPRDTAVAVLDERGCACRNLAYKHAGPANFYALVRILQGYGIRPRAVVIEVNREVFSPDTAGYRSLAGPVAQLSAPFVTAEDRATFVSARAGLHAQLDRALASLSLLYAMRLDIREAIYGDNDPAPPPLDPQLGRLLYDLPQLDEKNVSVRYLEKTVALLRAAGTPVVAFLVPVNHAAIDGLVDRARFRANSRYLEGVLARGGAHVLDLESSFTAGEFVDEAHLNAQGQRRLASILANALRETVGEVTRPENRTGYGR